MIKKKNIVLGITGGIAAYKAANLTSTLTKLGYSVHVFMTKAALEFITPLTMQTLSKNPVWMDELHLNKSRYVPHIDFANEADLFIVVPASANTIAKVAGGIADNLLTTTLLATKAPVIFASAMNSNMYEHPITQDNITKLKNLGYHFVEPASGMLACGVSGKGRLADLDKIMEKIDEVLQRKTDLSNKNILITAGGTREPIDPVRYIGNRSSGKMGFALAEAAVNRGANVTLVAANTKLDASSKINLIKVETAEQMKDIVFAHFKNTDVVIKAAAVSDYTPVDVAQDKIKKKDDELVLNLRKNTDILYELGKNKNKQILVGFAAETSNLLANAHEKITKKNLDLIVANDVTREGAGFEVDTNLAILIYPNGKQINLPLMGKDRLAQHILDAIVEIS